MSTEETPEGLSTASAVTVTVAELVVVFIAVGLNVKLVRAGGCVWANAGSAAMAARSSRNRVLEDFLAKLFLRADMQTPPRTWCRSSF
jgi:hypothetical protein